MRKMVGMPAVIIVTAKLPTPGTSRVSTRLPVGNIAPPSPSPSSEGSRNSSTISAAGKVTPSSSKSPLSCTCPSTIGTWARMVLPILACQIRTVQVPLRGMRVGSMKPLLIANGPTAVLRLPQLPLQSTNGVSMATWPYR
ncbi:hypothetical protein D3C71_1561850 [compost metagenome]